LGSVNAPTSYPARPRILRASDFVAAQTDAWNPAHLVSNLMIGEHIVSSSFVLWEKAAPVNEALLRAMWGLATAGSEQTGISRPQAVSAKSEQAVRRVDRIAL